MSARAAFRLAIFAALVVGIGFAYLHRGDWSPEALQARVREAGAMGALLFVAFYAVATVLFVPGSLVTLAAGALFGPAWGAFYSLSGATLGAVAAFLIARYLAGGWVRRQAGERLGRILAGVEGEGWRFVAFTRLMPVFPFNALNYALGLTRIALVQYAAATFVCMAPGAFAYAYLGFVGREAATGSANLVGKAAVAAGLLAALAFVPRLVRRLRATRGTTESGVPQTLSAGELKRRLDRREAIAVIDVRASRDFAGELGHVEGALNIPLDELPRRLKEIEHLRDRSFAVICRTNRMSGEAVELLRRSGFAHAMLVSDGMKAWRENAAAEEGGRAAS